MASKLLCYSLISALGFFLTFKTVCELVVFLSFYDSHEEATQVSQSDYSGSGGNSSTTKALAGDALLLTMFMLQHSVMAMPSVKNILRQMDLIPLERSLYVIATSLTLQMLMALWIPVTQLQLWSIQHSVMFWPVRIIHAYAWIVVYMGSITMDIVELLGVKQVYYATHGFPDPLSYKSRELQRFYHHMRHPSFMGFSIIFFTSPIMTADRVVLAVTWTAYMAVRWKVDKQDLRYQEQQLERKSQSLLNCARGASVNGFWT